MSKEWHESDFAGYLGVGIMFFLIMIGIGSCISLWQHSDAVIEKAKYMNKQEAE